MSRKVAAVLFAVLALGVTTSAASSPTGRPVTGREWQSALDDVVSHGRFTAPHSCAAVVVARTHAPPRHREGSRVVHVLDVYLYARCRTFGRVHSLRVGMTDRRVVGIAGAPVPWLSGPTCWVYRGRAFDALRVCFSSGHVTSLGFAPHG